MTTPAPRPFALGRRASALATVLATLTLASCGGGNDNPFAGKATPEDGGTTPAAVVAPAAPATDPEVLTPPIDPVPTSAAAAPGPTASSPSQDDSPPGDLNKSDLDRRVEQDQEAMLNARTMVSIIEGCHSGRSSYKDCNSHDELGSPSVLGIEIGKRSGQVKISATPRGFRVTANSESGAKFTVARGPGGDRFKCIAGAAARRMPGRSHLELVAAPCGRLRAPSRR